MEIKAIKEVAVASITEQLATRVFIKRGPDYILFHKTNEVEITNFLDCFPSQTTVYRILGLSQIPMGPHDLQTQLLVVDFTYRTDPIRSSFIWITAGGRFPLEIGEVKSQGAPQRTTRTLTGFTHHSCGTR